MSIIQAKIIKDLISGAELGVTDLIDQIVTGTRNLSDYAALRNYKGNATFVQITKAGISGTFTKSATAVADNGGTSVKDGLGRSWVRLFDGLVSSKWFSTVGDGVVDDTAALRAFWVYLSQSGLSGRIPAGTYSISSEILTQLDNSFEVYADASANFVATSTFPSGGGIFKLGNSLNQNKTFKWIGGRFDGSKQPFTTDGSGSGCALLSVNASNCSHCHIEVDRMYTGPNWLEAGGDTHLFIGGPRNIYARVYESVGAWDSGIYLSRNFAGTIGESVDVDGNFYFCSVGVIVKRRFKTGKVRATTVDCITGAAIGQANIEGYNSAGGGSGYIFEVNANRTEIPVFLQSVRCVRGVANVDKLGVVIPAYTSAITGKAIPGYTSTSASGARFRGASDCQFDVNVSGVTAGITPNVNFCGAFFGPMTNDVDGTLQAVSNAVSLKASSIGSAFVEDGAGTNNNFVNGKVDGLLFDPVVIGSNTRYAFIQGNVERFTNERRMIDGSGKTLMSIGGDGSIGIGLRDGAASAAYLDFYSSGLTNRNSRIIASGGTNVSDSGVLALQAGQVTVTSPALDISGVLRPTVSGNGTIGQSARVFSTGYVTTAFTVTSDETHKDQINPINDDVLDAWSTVRYVSYKLREAIAAKGPVEARTHMGVIAQQVRDAFIAVGLDPFEYGILCYDEWDEVEATDNEEAQSAGSRYSIRYEEALVLEAALMRRTTERLEKRLMSLESK